MELKQINDLIDELEQSESSLSNIRNLSALYNVKTHLIGTKEYDSVERELKDILPSYRQYIDSKRRYQLKEITIERVYINMKKLCQEIKEFLQTLYSGTDSQEERDILNQLFKDMH